MPKSFLILLMLLIGLLTTPQVSTAETPKGCDPNYDIPQPIQAKIDEKEKRGEVTLEIVTQDPQGYIYELFVNELYLEGLFFYDETSRKMIVCSITHAIESGHEGVDTFAWSIDQKEM